MTMNTTAPSFADEQEQQPADDHTVPAAASSGNCVISVTGVGDDAGSIGSNSTNKTRFSFYNAQEVKKTEQEKQQLLQKGGESSASVNGNFRNGEDQQQIVAEDTANTEGGTSLTKSVVQVSLTTSTSNISTISGGHHHQNQQSNDSSNNNRFNFYVADDVDATRSSSAVAGDPAINSEAKEEDDRRSPHTPLVNENDGGQQHRTPAAVATTPQRTSAGAGAGAASTPSSAQKKKHKAIQAAAARARNSSKIEERCNSDDHNDDDGDVGGHSTSATDKTVNSNENDEVNANNKMDSVEILRSLKDTEQMRNNLMKECGKEGTTTKSRGARNKSLSKIGSSSSSSSGDNTKSNKSDVESHTSREIYQDAATFDSDGLQQQAYQLEQLTAKTGPMAAAATDYRNSLQRPASTIISSGAGPAAGSGGHHPGLGGGNAYEDAIREALDLLRKHRPPSPQQLVSQDTMNDDLQRLQQKANSLSVGAGIDMNVVQGAVSSPMMRDNSNNNTDSGTAGVDRVLQSRWESPHDPEEVDARRKERQERMARYTSRLAELKNGDQPAIATPANESDSDTDTDNKRLPPLSTETMSSNDQDPPPSFAACAVHNQVSSACLSEEMASVGTASSLSASHYGNSAANPKEVHRSVERVLLAILERAHSNGRATQVKGATNPSSPSPYAQYATTLTANLSQASSSLAPSAAGGVSTIRSDDPSLYQRGGPGGSVGERSDSPATQPPPPVEADALLRAVGDLLNTTGAGSSSVMSGASVTSPPLRSDGTERSNTTAGTKRSVVEELLAEAESFGGDQAAASSAMASPKQKAQHQQLDSHNSHDLPDKREAKNSDAEALLNCSTGVEAVRSGDDGRSTVVDKGLDELVLKTLGKSPTKEKRPSESATEDVEEDTGDYDDEEVESQTRTGSYDDDDDSYDEDSDSDEDLDEALEGVLGPLSGNDGGTTGVVLESNLSPDRSIFDSLSNAMSSFVASAISGEDRGKLSVRDKYSTDKDHDEADSGNQDGNASSGSEVDKEASELMRSLCAHLLPFGVDQSSRLLDEVPQWEDENPNEAGYRIIRLTSQQLQRVEHAFEAMVHTLKKASEQNLIAEGKHSDIDASFERDLAVAEKALDGEEEGRTTAIMKALKLVPNTDKKGKAGAVTVVSDNDEDDGASVDDTVSSHPDVCHPDFPGIHSAGRGEMGDLEYFNLPIIFKSHVTGFEPTKDMFLEPGNVVAGQYLVENELGSAAFSTAYRCVDLNSEGVDTEDVRLSLLFRWVCLPLCFVSNCVCIGVFGLSQGHEEVCLKVIKNTKDFFDQSLDEIKILELLRQTGKCHENNILVMKTFFYHREHLIIVTELLRQNLFEFGKFILDHDEEPYFTLPRLGYITRQCLIALRFVHKLGLVHSDIKPENLLLASYSRAQVKVIDFGSSCYLTDRQSSYIQSRSYRAPEVVLGLPYDGKIDVWSMGCVVAEMFTGEVTFQNDSMVSMLSRIEAICGPFPRHMIAQGRQSCRFFTKCGLLFEKVSGGGDDDGRKTPDVSEDDDSDAGRPTVFDIFQPKTTTLSARLGFAADLHDRYTAGTALSQTEKQEAMFVDFVRKSLSIDPDSRPSAAEALKHPWMVYAASLTEEDIKYPSH